MNGMIDGALIGAVVGAVAGLAVAVMAMLQKPKKCPKCGTPVPKTRKPANRRQLLWGGWTCAECGCEIDRRVRKVGR